MSSHKSCFLREEHAWEAMMSWWVAEFERQLESTRRESQDWEAEAAELLTVEWATAAKRGLDAAKVHLAETEAAL